MATRTRHLPRNAQQSAIANREAGSQIRDYLEGLLDINYWELSQEEADAITSSQNPYISYDEFAAKLKKQGKSKGAIYIASRIRSGANPDLYELTNDWFAHRNIKKALSVEQLREIGASAGDLRRLGIKWAWEAQRFYDLYREVMVKSRVWASSCQINQHRVKAIAFTPNYNRLPQWVREGLMKAPDSAQIGGDRIGNIWRLIPCVKAWKWAQFPKGVAERVGKMSPRMRMLAAIAWQYRDTWVEDRHLSQGEQVKSFWLMLQALESNTLLEQCEWGLKLGRYSFSWGAKRWATFLSESLSLPYGVIELPKEVTIEAIQEAIIQYASPAIACQTLFGVSGKATIKAFQNSDRDRWNWAKAIAYGDADAVQKILNLGECVSYQPDAINFLKSLPMQSRIRLLQATTFKYRGQINPISDDHVRDTGYLWSNIQNKPELGRIRCWFSVHETLAAAYVAELPDEALPIPQGWEKVNGLCAVDRSWELEFPRRVATLKYYGQALRNCVGGYGNAIKSGRSVIFVVREQGVLTHCVEISDGYVRQFYRSGNSEPDYTVKESVIKALEQAKLL